MMVLQAIPTCFVGFKLLFGFLIHPLVFLHPVIGVCVCVSVRKEGRRKGALLL